MNNRIFKKIKNNIDELIQNLKQGSKKLINLISSSKPYMIFSIFAFVFVSLILIFSLITLFKRGTNNEIVKEVLETPNKDSVHPALKEEQEVQKVKEDPVKEKFPLDVSVKSFLIRKADNLVETTPALKRGVALLKTAMTLPILIIKPFSEAHYLYLSEDLIKANNEIDVRETNLKEGRYSSADEKAKIEKDIRELRNFVKETEKRTKHLETIRPSYEVRAITSMCNYVCRSTIKINMLTCCLQKVLLFYVLMTSTLYKSSDGQKLTSFRAFYDVMFNCCCSKVIWNMNKANNQSNNLSERDLWYKVHFRENSDSSQNYHSSNLNDSITSIASVFANSVQEFKKTCTQCGVEKVCCLPECFTQWLSASFTAKDCMNFVKDDLCCSGNCCGDKNFKIVTDSSFKTELKEVNGTNINDSKDNFVAFVNKLYTNGTDIFRQSSTPEGDFRRGLRDSSSNSSFLGNMLNCLTCSNFYKSGTDANTMSELDITKMLLYQTAGDKGTENSVDSLVSGTVGSGFSPYKSNYQGGDNTINSENVISDLNNESLGLGLSATEQSVLRDPKFDFASQANAPAHSASVIFLAEESPVVKDDGKSPVDNSGNGPVVKDSGTSQVDHVGEVSGQSGLTTLQNEQTFDNIRQKAISKEISYFANTDLYLVRSKSTDLTTEDHKMIVKHMDNVIMNEILSVIKANNGKSTKDFIAMTDNSKELTAKSINNSVMTELSKYKNLPSSDNSHLHKLLNKEENVNSNNISVDAHLSQNIKALLELFGMGVTLKPKAGQNMNSMTGLDLVRYREKASEVLYNTIDAAKLASKKQANAFDESLFKRHSQSYSFFRTIETPIYIMVSMFVELISTVIFVLGLINQLIVSLVMGIIEMIEFIVIESLRGIQAIAQVFVFAPRFLVSIFHFLRSTL